MDTFTPGESSIPLSLPCVQGPAHARLHGELTLHPASPGLVVLAYASPVLDAREHVLAGILRHGGLSTLVIDLVAREEEHYSDLHNNVPLLARRLVDVLDLIKNRMLMGELKPLPFGLCAANATSPVAVRVAALRDHDIAAVVCRDGLIDLAGVLYLRSLASPLLLLVEESDELHAASNRRALAEVTCPKELRLIPAIGVDYAVSAGIAACLREATEWFAGNFGTPERREAE